MMASSRRTSFRFWLFAGVSASAIAIAVVAALWLTRRSPASASAAFPPSAARTTDAQAAAAAPARDEALAGAVARGEVAIDARRQQLIGVRTVRVERKPLTASVRAVGLVRYDETRLTDINLKVEAWIRSLTVDYTGQFVRQGQTLFTVYSPELLATQQEYALALESRDQLAPSQLADTRHYADRVVDAARQRLALWDLSSDQMRALEQGRPPEPIVTFRSPVSGFVIEKRAVQGLHVMPGDTLYKIVDLSTVWVEADVYEQELSLMRVGAPATVTLDAYPDERFRGRAIYVYPFVDEKTRTVKVRFALPNAHGRLKPGMYANVELTGPVRTGLAVPVDAVLDSGTDRVVFVAQGDGHFEPRHVTPGQRLGDTIEIRDGLAEGEQIATGAAFFLDSESQLRASLQGYEAASASAQPPPPTTLPPTTLPPTTQPTMARPAMPRTVEQHQISLRTQPDPPKAGESQLEVEVKTSDGTPVSDAEVTVVFFMAGMPAMNMPAMRNEAKLPAAGNGLYRGAANIMMAGRWDVSVIVSRNGQRLGTRQLTVVTR
jgi:RND family efflux transporter MFP subunit